MKTSAIFSLIPLAAALPASADTPASSGAYGVIASRSGSPIQYLPLTASGGHFYLGGKSKTDCPSETVSNCSGRSTDTILIGNNALVSGIPCDDRGSSPPSNFFRLLISFLVCRRARWSEHLR